MEGTTDSIRALACKWSLAGDEKLLKLLQTTHQKIISKCQEVNTRLDEMAAALGGASIDLQNVNNKFMALSNSQFIESRVYDDDADVQTETKPVEASPKPEGVDEVSLLQNSLRTLEQAHETAEIMDSDTDDSDAEICVVLKPRDAYAHRPLPYIIGSQPWKNKWHAGLVIEESDSDSSTSRQDVRDMEQYSESEEDVQTYKHVPDVNVSGSSSSLHSHEVSDKRPPAVVAAELAAWLGNAPPVAKEPEPEEDLPQPTTKTVYRPQKPVTSTIFSDEPPPLETEHYSSESQEEDDIFAEINKKQPYNNNNMEQNPVDDLFGTVTYDYNDFSGKKIETTAKQKSTLFDDESEPELFVDKPVAKENSQSTKIIDNNDTTTKKPVGGISLFGSNKGTESIGAAILKRNQRKSSSSEHESDDNTQNTIRNEPAETKRKNSEEVDNANNANAIFDNLFAKAKQAEQKLVKPVKIDEPVKVKAKPKEVKDVKDLFSDNIFDDIDDIFTSNIKIPTKEDNKNAKSIFDDDDDLFSDVAKKPSTKATSSIVATSGQKKSIFDSDDDLFSDIKVTKNEEKTTKIEFGKESQTNKPKTVSKEINDTKPPVTTKESTIFDESTKNNKVNEPKEKPKAKSKSIFDSDSDDDLFSDIKTAKPKIQSNKNSININSETETELFKEKKETKAAVTLETENPKVIQSPSLFEEDEIDDLFINANKAKEVAAITPKNEDKKTNIPKESPDFKDIHKMLKDQAEVEDIDEKIVDKSDIYIENIPNKAENQVPVIVSKKNYVLPKIDEVSTKSDRSFDDNLLEDNLFTKATDKIAKVETENDFKDDAIENSQKPIKEQSKSSSIDISVKPKLKQVSVVNEALKTEEQKLDFSKTINQENVKANEPDQVSNEKQDILPEEKKSIPIGTAFDDIFSEPPAFEKTKEIKKVTNVNALFEDDSDDESLFFKKNDVISDEKPELFSPSADFGIFNDEPPDLDADLNTIKNDNFDDLFSSAPKKAANTLNENQEDEWSDDLKKMSESIPKPPKILFPDDFDTNLFSSPETVKATTVKVNKEIPESDDELFRNIKDMETGQKEDTRLNSESKTEKSVDQVDDTKDKEVNTENTETKKIGKINTKNFNINVQALVPGASPKKVPKERMDEIDNINTDSGKKEELKTTKDIEETVDTAEPKPVKLSFESKPEAGVLDNNLSKQRAKIQVKRRPSTRRARHEAVRKSVIGVDDDTDNSSSFDEPKPKINLDQKSNISLDQDKTNLNTKDESKEKNNKTKNEKDKDEKPNELKTDDFDDSIAKSSDVKNKFNIHDEITKDIQRNVLTDEVDSEINYSNEENIDKIKDFTKEVDKNDLQKSPQSTTKVVYILNDEDIFKTNEDNDDDFFKPGIKTIANTYKDTKNQATSNINTEIKNDNSIVREINEYNDDDLFKPGIKTIGNTYKDTKNQATSNINTGIKNDNSIVREINEYNDDDLFKPGIKTIGNTYKEAKIDASTTKNEVTSNINTQIKNDTTIVRESSKQPAKEVKQHEAKLHDIKQNEAKQNEVKQTEVKSIFDLSDDDEDLFGKSAKIKKIDTKSKLFDSDSEDELFSGRKGKDKMKEVKSNVKGSLFGDDDDDDDLFGTKKTVAETSKVSSLKATTSKEATKPTEIVFDDPLTMLDGD